jgi:hypothetical protein
MAEEIKKKRGRGRPLGVKNGEGKKKASIKKWSPKHDLIVQLHVSLHSPEEISAMVGCSSGRVLQVLSDPKGKKLVQLAQGRLREKLSAEVEDGLVSICVKALDNIRETIELEGLVHGSDFKKHQDRLSLDVLKGRGFLNKDGVSQDAVRGPINENMAERLIKAIEKSNEASDLIAQTRAENEIVVQEAEEVPREGSFKLVTTE